MKAIIIAAIALLSLVPLIGRVGMSAEQSRIATVSLQRIGAESAVSKAARQKLDAFRQQKANELTAIQKEMESTHQQLLEAERGADGPKRAQLMIEEDRHRADFQRLTQAAQVDLANLQRELQIDLLAKVNPILADIGAKQGFDAILNADIGVAWAPRSTDVTTEVLQRLEAESPTAVR